VSPICSRLAILIVALIKLATVVIVVSALLWLGDTSFTRLLIFLRFKTLHLSFSIIFSSLVSLPASQLCLGFVFGGFYFWPSLDIWISRAVFEFINLSLRKFVIPTMLKYQKKMGSASKQNVAYSNITPVSSSESPSALLLLPSKVVELCKNRLELPHNKGSIAPLLRKCVAKNATTIVLYLDWCYWYVITGKF
jgi:hypothetical protein